ncbi:hypothetical protein KJ972_02845 [Candidatus Micrarchaeota archaeon]|nr:hypothetical protein [Patescibacteria group bacterium]MBU1930420.1 hypothetical protein [Candidatus Micrarchaeota archaeon]
MRYRPVRRVGNYVIRWIVRRRKLISKAQKIDAHSLQLVHTLHEHLIKYKIRKLKPFVDKKKLARRTARGVVLAVFEMTNEMQLRDEQDGRTPAPWRDRFEKNMRVIWKKFPPELQAEILKQSGPEADGGRPVIVRRKKKE